MFFKKSDKSDDSEPGGKLNVKKLFSELLESAEEPRADPRMISALGAVGILLVVLAIVIKAWDGWSGWTTSQAASTGHEVVQQLNQAVAPFLGLNTNQELLALANAALEDPEELPAAEAWLDSRLGGVTSVSIYPGAVYDQRPEEMGPNGFALVSMMYIAAQGVAPPLQIHYSLEPPQLVQVLSLRDGDAVKGFLSITANPEPILAAFNPKIGDDSFIALRQDYGREGNKPLKQAGNPERAPSQPDRLMVAGTLFRVEMPLHQANELLPWGRFITVVFVGLLMVAAARFLQAKNKRWMAAAEEERAVRKEAEARKAEAVARRKEEQEKARVAAAARLAEEKKQADSLPDEGARTQEKEVSKGADSSEPPPLRLRYDIAERWKKGVDIPHVELQESIFRAYDIRGEIGKSLDVDIAYQVGQAVGSTALDREAGPVVVARDGRLSGPQLADGLIDGIKSTGCDVINIGSVPTGVLYFAAFEKGAGTGVMVTGSHNPPAYNGFKVMIGGQTLFGEEIGNLYQRIKQGDVRVGRGKVSEENVVEDYCKRIADDIQLERPLRAVVDCGNGVGGVCAAQALRGIGAEVLPLFDEVDGTFPNHHPDPSEPENLEELLDSVKLMGADIGLALDGDADRLGVVTADGEIIYPDRVMMLLARDVLERVPGAVIIYDVKCTGHLADEIEKAGGKPVMYKTGHSLIKEKMKEIGSPFAGEMSGHFFFEERWYGVDDGIYSAARLLEILAKSEQTPTEILKALPTGVSTPELKVEMEEGQNHAFIKRLQEEGKFPGAKVSTIDGLRADYGDGWGLCRASNTTPVLIVRFDADSEDALRRIKQTREINSDLKIPF
jgi:phosphomannomutase